MNFNKLILFIRLLCQNMFLYGYYINAVLLAVSYFLSYIHPDAFILAPLISLIFPLLVAVHLFYLFYFLLRFKIIKSIVSIIIICFFIPTIRNYYNITFNSNKFSTKDSSIFSMMSFNVKLFDLYNWQQNKLTREKIFQYLNTHRADVICFQEFYTSEDSNDFNNLEKIKALFPSYTIHQQYFVTLRRNDHWGLLTLSKFPIVNKGIVDFNNAKNNGCIFTDVIINKDTVRIYNVHLQSYSLFKTQNKKNKEESFFNSLNEQSSGKNFFSKISYSAKLRSRQLDAILRIVHENKYPSIIIGDFNDMPNSYLIRTLHKENFSDAFEKRGNGFGLTFHDKLYGRIDYVMYDKKFQCLSFFTDNENTQHLSDHYPIKAFLKLSTTSESKN